MIYPNSQRKLYNNNILIEKKNNKMKILEPKQVSNSVKKGNKTLNEK